MKKAFVGELIAEAACCGHHHRNRRLGRGNVQPVRSKSVSRVDWGVCMRGAWPSPNRHLQHRVGQRMPRQPRGHAGSCPLSQILLEQGCAYCKRAGRRRPSAERRSSMRSSSPSSTSSTPRTTSREQPEERQASSSPTPHRDRSHCMRSATRSSSPHPGLRYLRHHRAVQRASPGQLRRAHASASRSHHRRFHGVSRSLGHQPRPRPRPPHLLLRHGLGPSAFPSPQNYWWIPIVAPLLGGVVGGAAYQVLIHQFPSARNRARSPQPISNAQVDPPQMEFGRSLNRRLS